MTDPTHPIPRPDMIQAAEQARAIASGEEPAPRMTFNGHVYVPEARLAEIDRLREALTAIERLYYTEGTDASWRAVQMRAIANAALENRDE